MQKKLLILGAGIYQVPLIKKAKEMGLYAIAASCPGNYPGFSIADEVWEIDTTDYRRLLERAGTVCLSGVCTTGTDVSVISVGHLCEKLSLSGIPLDAARRATDKAAMKEAFVSCKVSTPAAVKVYSEREARQAFQVIGSPAVIKAVDSSGSRGINRVDHISDISRAYEQAMSVTHKNYVLVESFIKAHEIGVDGLISGGQVLLLLPHDKFTHTADSATLPEGHRFPYCCSDRLRQKIEAEIKNAAKAMRLDDCAFNADVLVTDDQIYILEMGGRAGATCIPELISIYTGLDYYKCLIQIALGEPVHTDSLAFPKTPCMAKLLFSKKDGKITEIDREAIAKLTAKNPVSVSLDYREGDEVQAVRNGTNRIGQVILQSEDLIELERVMSAARRSIKIDGVDLETLWNE